MDRLARRGLLALLAVVVVFAPQAGGAVYRWSAIVVAITALSTVVMALSRQSVWENARVDPTCWVLTGMAAFTLLQLIPLPQAMAGAISPGLVRLYSEAALLPQGLPRTFVPLTADFSVTATEAAKWASYAAVYVTILNWPRGSGHQLAKTVVAAGAVTLFVCLIESLFRVSSILGIYQPAVGVASWLRGPFVNPGHTGIYCALMGTLCLGAAAELSPRWRNWIRLLGGGLLIVALTPESLKTTVAATTGPGVFFFLRARAVNRPLTRGPLLWVALPLLLCAGGLLIWWLPSPMEIRRMPDRYLAFRRFSRIITWSDTLRLIHDFPLAGVGRGAYGLVFTSYDTVNTDVITWHAENTPLQMAAEWGIVPTLVFLGGMTGAVLGAARSARGSFPSAAAAALVMLGVVNLVDFDLELLGIGLTASVCLGVLMRKETRSVRIREGRAALMAPGFMIVASIVAILTVGSHTLDRDAKTVRELTKPGVDRVSLDRVGGVVAGRHPADFFLPQLVAAEHLRLQTSLGLPWLNRALTLRPSGPEAHYLTGVALQRAGRNKQALLEYVLSARYANRLVKPVGTLILNNPPLRRIALGDAGWAGTGDLALLEYLSAALDASGKSEEAFRLDEELLQLGPGRAASTAALKRESGIAARDPALLKRLDAALRVDDGEQSDSYLIAAADIRAKAGRVSEAEQLLERAAMGAADPREATVAWIKLMLEGGKAAEALRRLDELQQKGRLAAGDAEFLRGRAYEKMGNVEAALRSFVLAAQYRPQEVEVLVAAALSAHRAERRDLEVQYSNRALEAGHGSVDVRERLAPILGP